MDSSVASYLVDNPQIAESRSSDRVLQPNKARETAQKFEALLLQTMLKAMRKTTPGDTLFGSEQANLYLDMFDQQIAADVSKNSGLGIADAIYRQIAPQSDASITGQSATNGIAAPSNVGEMKPSVSAWSTRIVVDKTTQQQFIHRIAGHASKTAQSLGTSMEAVAAIAALESGWGGRVASRQDGTSTYNLFGIKADSGWSGKSNVATTKEFLNGAMQSSAALFRAYDSEQQSIHDFGDFIRQNPRYHQALEQAADPERFIREIHKAGYATDPDYADKAIEVLHEIQALL